MDKSEQLYARIVILEHEISMKEDAITKTNAEIEQLQNIIAHMNEENNNSNLLTNKGNRLRNTISRLFNKQ